MSFSSTSTTCGLLLSGLFLVTPINAQTTHRVSVDSAGVQSNGLSSRPSISANGRIIAFYSDASNLVPGDTNLVLDVFVHDRDTGVTERVSVSSTGAQGLAKSSRPDMSPDGRWVAFYSDAPNLVPGDTNLSRDVFIHDRTTGQTTRVSVTSAGVEGNAGSSRPRISADGRFIAFRSDASNLVPGDTNLVRDCFLHDRDTDGDGIFDEPGAISTVRVSVSTAGVQGNGISSIPVVSNDGRYVAFRSFASNLVPGDTNLLDDVFVRDLVAGTTTRVSVSSSGAQGDLESSRPMISGTGRYIAFYSRATNFAPGDTNEHCQLDLFGNLICKPARDAFVRDRDTDGNGIFDEPGGTATIAMSVSEAGVLGNDRSEDPDISTDGRYVVFWTNATNLVPNDTNGFQDLILHDRDADGNGIFDEPGGITNRRVSVSTSGTQGNSDSKRPVVSDDGTVVAFRAISSNMVIGDSNLVEDVFVHDLSESSPYTNLFSSMAGTSGPPHLLAEGTLQPNALAAFATTDAMPGTISYWLLGLANLSAPFKGGILVPSPQIILTLPTDASGGWVVAAPWPVGIPAGVKTYYQTWVTDAGGPHGFAATNGLEATTP